MYQTRQKEGIANETDDMRRMRADDGIYSRARAGGGGRKGGGDNTGRGGLSRRSGGGTMADAAMHERGALLFPPYGKRRAGYARKLCAQLALHGGQGGDEMEAVA